MWQALKNFRHAHKQTKFFVFTIAIYMAAIVWTTIQVYARQAYNRGDLEKPIIIEIPSTENK